MPRTDSEVEVLGRANSISPLRYGPEARPPGFHHHAVASSATAVKAPPIPWARIPMMSVVWALATTADRATKERTEAKEPRTDTTDQETLRMSLSLAVSSMSFVALCALEWRRAAIGETRLALSDEYSCGDDRGPQTFLVSDGGLRDVLRADDLVREPVDLFLLVPALVGIELQAERRGEHLGSEFFGVVAGDVFALPEAVMFGQVAVQLAVARDRHADG